MRWESSHTYCTFSLHVRRWTPSEHWTSTQNHVCACFRVRIIQQQYAKLWKMMYEILLLVLVEKCTACSQWLNSQYWAVGDSFDAQRVANSCTKVVLISSSKCSVAKSVLIHVLEQIFNFRLLYTVWLWGSSLSLRSDSWYWLFTHCEQAVVRFSVKV